MRIIAIDTETKRFGEQPDGSFLIHPPIICTSWATREPEGIVPRLVSDGDGEAMLNHWVDWLQGPNLLVFHNAAYDLNVAIKTWPKLEPLIWEKLERGQITCTKVREKLLHLSTHGNLDYIELPDGTNAKLTNTLADVAARYLGWDLSDWKDGDESVRTQYDLYQGMPARNYPAEARHYALQDAYIPLAVYEAQSSMVKTHHGPASLSTEFFQTACDFALAMATDQGMPIDQERVLQLQDQMRKVLSPDNLRPLLRTGILRPAVPAMPYVKQLAKATDILRSEGVTGDIQWETLHEDYRALLEAEGIKFKQPKDASLNRKVLCDRVEAICKRIGQPPKLTDTKRICTDTEVVQNLMAFDEHLDLEAGDAELPDGSGDEPIHPRRMSPLENYQYRQKVNKIVTTEIPRMMWGPEGEEKPADRVHFNFNVLVSTGRTSSFASKHYPSANGQNVDPRARPCYLPEPGHWLLSVDYSTLELCSVAQTTYELFGYSEHRNKINAGMDLHANLATTLSSYLSSSFKGTYNEFVALKATEPKFYELWRKFSKPVGLGLPGGLGATTFISLAKKTYGVDIVKAAADVPLNLLPGPENTTVAWHAARAGLDMEQWEWTPFVRGIALAVLLKQLWLETYPEMVAYFEWVTQQIDPHNSHTNDDGEREARYCYTTPLGMYRAACTFPAIANGKAMQSPSGEGAKTAVYHLMKDCHVGDLRGHAHFHNFVHDEVILSVPAEPAAAADVIKRVEQLAVECMQNIMPDVRISVESALATRWYKEAKPVRSRSSGLLVPWEPGASYEVDDHGALWVP